MTTSLLASGTSEAQSADFTLTPGQYTNIVLSGDAGAEPTSGSFVRLMYKTSAGTYVQIRTLQAHFLDRMAQLIGPGTFRVERPASPVALGVDRD